MAFDFREEALRGLVALREVLDHLIGESFTRHAGGQATAPGSFTVDVFEQATRYVLQASLPGVKPEDLVIQAQGNTIIIRGERQLFGEQTDHQWILRENQPIAFFRSITLPGAIDAVAASAQLELGLLTLELPKVEAMQIIPLSTRTTAMMPTADSAHETVESSSAMPADTNVDMAVADTDTIPELEAIAPTIQDTAEIDAPIDEADAEVAPMLSDADAEDTSEDAMTIPMMVTVNADEAIAIDATALDAINADEAIAIDATASAAINADEAIAIDATASDAINADDTTELVAIDEVAAETIIVAAAEETEEVLNAIQEAEAIVEAIQEAALAAELADVASDETTTTSLTEVAAELTAVEEILIAEEHIVEELAEAVAELQSEAVAIADETLIDEARLAETPDAEAESAETVIIEAEIVTTLEAEAEIVTTLEAEAEAVAIAEAINAVEADTSEQQEGVVVTVPEMTADVSAADDASHAEVAAVEALTETTIIAEELAGEIVHEVEGELVREIFAEMAEAQREAVADVIAEALLADVLDDAAPTAMLIADALTAEDDATPLTIAAKLEEAR